MHLQIVAERFGSTHPVIPLKGGRGLAFRSGSIIIKLAKDENEASWAAETFRSLVSTEELRISEPILSDRGRWIEDGYVAWSFLAGEHFRGRYREKLLACSACNRSFARIERPPFLATRVSPWAVADRRAWGEEPIRYEQEFKPIYKDLLGRMESMDLPSQIIHGDFSGNVLLAAGMPPAVIDFSPYWRPADFSMSVMLMDAAAWDQTVSAEELLAIFVSVEDIEQLALRATLRRIFEQFEHIGKLGLNRKACLTEAIQYQRAFRNLFGKEN